MEICIIAKNNSKVTAELLPWNGNKTEITANKFLLCIDYWVIIFVFVFNVWLFEVDMKGM